MKAIITGASSGLGKEFAIQLSKMGYDLVLVARRKDKLKEIKQQLETNVEIVCLDLSFPTNCVKLFKKYRKDNINILINNAGFGVFGTFDKTPLDKELEMIDTNIVAVHTLTKLFLQKFKKDDAGYIMNVASAAAFQPGPLMASYYASKSYVYNLSAAIWQELKKEKSNVKISVLCPGPVNTEFNDVAGVKFGVKAQESNDVVKYALNQMFKNKLRIIPGFYMRLLLFLEKFVSYKSLLKITYNIQKSKVK
ncbi:MAG: SDR family oxidoreductase [Bacilli bacterium]|nr:SDR family oxidoreductase [Bacilli bacterium]